MMPPRSTLLLALTFSTLAAEGCSASSGSSAPEEHGGTTTGVGGGLATTTAGGGGGGIAGGGIGGGLLGGGGGSTGGGCSADNQQIYVISKQYDLYRFSPATLAVAKVGPIACPGAGAATPFSMSVDRQGTAWVLFNDGNFFEVSTADASCQATSFVVDQSGFKKFGMGFVSDAAGSEAETLFVANEFGLGKIDTSTLVVTPIGQFGFSAAAELTGTGAGELYGLFFGFPPYISKLDKQTGALGAEQPLDDVDTGTGFAFAFWGGGFWVFTAPGGTSSQVDHYDPSAATTATVVADLGFKVVGAGVSTCAPVELPK